MLTVQFTRVEGDQCGAMLSTAGMGGMAEMGVFYDHCLQALYPPGSCGTFCTPHTYQCYLEEVHQSCCDENGLNCLDGQDIPLTCPIGCAVIFPEFLETCRVSTINSCFSAPTHMPRLAHKLLVDAPHELETVNACGAGIGPHSVGGFT